MTTEIKAATKEYVDLYEKASGKRLNFDMEVDADKVIADANGDAQEMIRLRNVYHAAWVKDFSPYQYKISAVRDALDKEIFRLTRQKM